MELVVNTPFLTYNVGDLISDPAIIASVLAGQYANDVVVIGQSGGQSSPEAISLAATSAVTGAAISLAGSISNATPSALDYSIDGATWSPVTSYVLTGGNFTGKGPTYATAQSGSIQVRDHTNQSIVSGTANFTVTVSGGGGGGGGGSGNGTLTLADGSKINGLAPSLEVTGGSGTPGPLSVQFGTITGSVADGGMLAVAAAQAAAAVPSSSVGIAGGVAGLDAGGHVPATTMAPIGTQAWAEQTGTSSIFHRGTVPTPLYPRSGMSVGDKWKLGAVFNFGEVWDTQASYDAYPQLQSFLLYCQMMRLAMHNTALDNVAFRTFVDCFLPAGDYLVSSSLIVPEYVRLTGPGRIVRTPYVGAQSGGTLTHGPFYATDGNSAPVYLPTVVITARAHAGILNVYTNGGSGSIWFRGSGVAVGKFWCWLYGGAVTIGAAGSGYSVGDFIYSASPQISPYQGGYIVVDSVNGSGGVTAAHVYAGDRLGNGGQGCGAYGLPPSLQTQQWTTANGFNVFDPARAGYFIQASTFNAAGGAGAGTGCTFLPTWMSDFAGGNYQFGGYGQRSPIQADTLIEHINITGGIHANYSATYGSTFGVQFSGLNGICNEIEMLGGNMGVQFIYANDWRLPTINCVESGTGIQVYSSGSIEMPSVVLDTCGCALIVNESSRVIVRGLAFFEESNMNSGTVFPDSQNYAVLIGNASNSSFLNADLDIDLTLVNMGGLPQSTLNLSQFANLATSGNVAITMTASLYLAYVRSARIKLMISNWSESGQFYSYLPSMGFVEFHSGVDQSVVLEGCIDQIAGPACIGAVSASPCDVRVWDAGTGSGWPGGRAGPFGTYQCWGTGAPASGMGAGKAGPGSTYMNYANATLYRQTGTLASPAWTTP